MKNLDECLNFINSIHFQEIDLSLERILQAKRVLFPDFSTPVITVGGTNGKGSTCAMLSQSLVNEAFKVGTFTSPHLIRYNERVRIDMHEVSDELLVSSFNRVIERISGVSLTYFEFSLLGAMEIFVESKVDIVILEVGLGGRFDATNVFDPVLTIITTIDLDHESILGDTREKIAFEKLGIARAGVPLISGDFNSPSIIEERSKELGFPLYQLNRDFHFQIKGQQWSFNRINKVRSGLPLPALQGHFQVHNASIVLMALEILKSEDFSKRVGQNFTVSMGNYRRALLETKWEGRMQILAGQPMIVFDVAHNPHAARALAQTLSRMPFSQRNIAVFSALKDKNIVKIISILKSYFDEWFIAPITRNSRSLSIQELESKFKECDISPRIFAFLKDAYSAAKKEVPINGRIVVFGSFPAVSESLLEERKHAKE